jgi:AraC-like DNA-binding protein
LAAHLLENYSSLSQKLAVARAAPFSSEDTRLISDYINDRLTSNMSIAELSSVVGMARSQFIARFRATTHLMPHQFLIARRVAKARRLLLDQRLTPMEVATRCGFADEHHFATFFKRITGQTPTAFRRLAAS